MRNPGITGTVKRLTIVLIVVRDVQNVQCFVSPQRRGQQSNFAVALNALGFGVHTRTPVAVDLIRASHLVDAGFVLLLDLKLEFKLVDHARNLSRIQWCLRSDEIEIRELFRAGSHGAFGSRLRTKGIGHMARSTRRIIRGGWRYLRTQTSAVQRCGEARSRRVWAALTGLAELGLTRLEIAQGLLKVLERPVSVTNLCLVLA
jgi:hypothetical protein